MSSARYRGPVCLDKHGAAHPGHDKKAVYRSGDLDRSDTGGIPDLPASALLTPDAPFFYTTFFPRYVTRAACRGC